MNNEEYLEDLNIKIDIYYQVLSSIYNAMNDYKYELEYTCKYEKILNNPSAYYDLINEVQSVIQYYTEIKTYTLYISSFYEKASSMFAYLSNMDLFNSLANQAQHYYEVLLDNRIEFNRATIPVCLIYTEENETNVLFDMLKQNIANKSLTDEEKNTIQNFSEDEIYIWKYVGLL